MAILEVHGIQSGYGDVQILWGVELALQEQKLTALVGSNGMGKTTLLRTILGLVRPWAGQVRLEGVDITHKAPHEKAGLGLVLVPEGRQIFAGMSVLDNLEMGATPRHARRQLQRNLGRVFEMFPRLQDRKDQKAGTLSGGEQQMLAIGRGLMADPKVLMIDELSLGLAPVLLPPLFKTLRQLKELGITLLLVEQNVQIAMAISDHTCVIAQGKIEMEGPSRELLHNAHIRTAYLGL